MQTHDQFPAEKDTDDAIEGKTGCDDCGHIAEGTMFYAFSRSKGRYVPVFFICHACKEPSDASAPHP